MTYLKSGFEYHGLLQHFVVIGGMPLNADFKIIIVTTPTKYNTYSECVGALMEAWAVHHKAKKAPTRITPYSYCIYLFDSTTVYRRKEKFAIFGQGLEFFNQKRGIILSGVNTMQTTFVLTLTFGSLTYDVSH